MPDCLSGDRGSIPRGVATADSAAIDIDVPVKIRPRYLVYVSPWDIKIAEETTGPSSLRIEPSGVKSDVIPALWEETS